MEANKLELLAKIIKRFVIILLISLPLAGCSVFNDDDYIDDKPWSKPADWESQGMQLPY
ncbi:MAG: hypothetical protein NE328_10865 [Lentisphaeraceae bacterium]|nr:hypothetical protein [Lentisphaeraceae bacterium]